MSRPVLRTALTACLALVLHAGNARAADDPWALFIAHGDHAAAMDAYDVLDPLGYHDGGLDTAHCEKNAAALRKALDVAPVGAALQRAVLLCAEARGDDAAAEQASARIAALAATGLVDLTDVDIKAPLPVLTVADAEAIVASAGMEVGRMYYVGTVPRPWWPLVVIGRDRETGHERHLAFDFIDPAFRMMRTGDRHPLLRVGTVDEVIAQSVKNGNVSGLDAQAVQKASTETDMRERARLLRPAAVAGGVQSAISWARLCMTDPAMDCDALVDTLLPYAEDKDAWALALLAAMRIQGVGAQRDAAAGWTLLDQADAAWEGHGALALAVGLLAKNGQPLPPELVTRLDAAARDGAAFARRRKLHLALQEKGPAAAADLAYAESPALNARGWGYMELAGYHEAHGDAAAAQRFLQRAAEAGDADAQQKLGTRLITGRGLPADPARGRELLERAAHAHDLDAALQLASLAAERGEYVDAETWLIPHVTEDARALLWVAQMYVERRKGLEDKHDLGLKALEEMAGDAENGAEPRRVLARLLLAGDAMPHDAPRARRLLEQDATRGDHASETLLGLTLLEGRLGAVEREEGSRWMERGMAGGDARAREAFGAWLVKSGGTAEARHRGVDLLQKAAADDPGSAANTLAWALCTSPHADTFDAARGLHVAEALGPVDSMRGAWRDTLAACKAAAGRFDEAVELQARVAREFEPLSRTKPGDEPSYVKRLKLYRKHERYVESDGPVD